MNHFDSLAMENLYCYIAFFLSTIFILKLLYRRNQNLPPSPFSLPIIGHFHLLKQPIYQSLQTLSLQYGPILSLKLGSRSILVISSPSAVEECFTKNDIIFANRPSTMAGEHFTYNFTNPVWAPYGHFWRNLRRLLSLQIFSTNSLQKSSIIRQEEVYSLIRQLFKVSNGEEPQKVEFRYLSSILTFNITMRMLTGKPCVGEETAITDVGKKHLKDMKDTYFASLSMNVCDFFPVLRWVGYKGIEKGMINLSGKRDELLRGWIQETKQEKTSSLNTTTVVDEVKKRTLIQTLLSIHESEPEFCSDDVVKSITLMMFVAGTDTTATAMEWAMALLLNHPRVFQKLKAEIDDQVGHERLLNESDLSKLPYLRCVINETLRLYPPTPLLLPHFSAEDCTVGGFQISRGTILVVNAWLIHRDPKFWEKPERFNPERFQGIFQGQRETFKFIPFGVGRRACPGAGMALRTLSLALGALIQCFDWETLDKEMVDMRPVSGFVLSKAKPLEVVCSPRRSTKDMLSQL
ncbi:hypothetical protein F2P56_012335 [Juglans regia]|uniref:Cytochrome P450 81C13-like n=2 Tax=Juglans regia TaxID=51240 RepID=A0A2I4GJB0_JUGRE|nr:cytochrome P450 81C13-like [Juglans regia]KAF5468160.1 hypothetical protein F2P56_012335 [Juglans regia]